VRAVSKPTSHLLDIYDCWIHLATDKRQLATLRRSYGKNKVPTLDQGQFGCLLSFREQRTDRPDINHYVIYLDVALHRQDAGQLIDTVVHECTHLATGILDSVGAGYDSDSEPLAWLLGWLARWVWTSL
jgi:hypothetical protein